MTAELPEGWVRAPLTEIAANHDSRRIPLNATERSERRGDYPYYGANGQVDTIDNYLFDGEYVLLAEDGGFFDDPARNVAYQVSGKFWVNNHAHILSALGSIPSAFLLHMLNQIDWMPYVRGTTRLKLTQGGISNVQVDVPPLNEQRRIVAKIEALMTRSARAKEALDAIPALLDRYRQSVLAAAFRGDLTADWRTHHPDTEPASELLERTAVSRRKTQTGLPEIRVFRTAEHTPEARGAEAIRNLVSLPPTWAWAPLWVIADVKGGLTKGKHRKASDKLQQVPYLSG